jgi:uncharacterized protein DUF6328
MCKPQSIEDRLKIALDETRTSIMGVQILFGFQFQAVVQEGFASLSNSSKLCMGSALLLMVGSAALLMSPAAQHRLVEQGEATPRIVGATTRCIEVALLALAIGIAIDIYVVFDLLAGLIVGMLAAIAAFTAAVSFWYALPLLCPGKRKQESVMKHSRTPLSTKIDHMLTEARVILPGAQALLGFGLIAVLTRAFERLPPALKLAHGLGLGFLALSIVLLLAPAALHRLGFDGEDTTEAHRTGSTLLTAATATLAAGLAAAVMVAIGALSDRVDYGAFCAAATLLLLFALWYAWPLALRARMQRKQQD